MDDILNNDGTVKGAQGGTEMIRNRLLADLPQEWHGKYKIIHSRVRDHMFEDGKKHILLCHDTWNDPESQHLQDPELRKRFHKIVFVSHWQFNTYNIAHGIQYNESIVIPNGITPFLGIWNKPSDKIRMIYHTTPHRGLEILVPVFDQLYSEYGDILHLDVYSSFSIYGRGNQDEPYKPLFERCRNHPAIAYHGAVSNIEVREALRKTHIFAYPSIWPETSCIAAIEAMSARNIVVCPDFAALSETAELSPTYRFKEDPNEHAISFYYMLKWIIDHGFDGTTMSNSFEEKLSTIKEYIDCKHDRNEIANFWMANFPL